MAFSDLVNITDGAVRALLGGPVTYRTLGGVEAELRAIFEEEFRRADALRPGVAQIGPAVFIRLSELPSGAPALDDEVEYGSVPYRVREIQPDGQGGALLHLIRT